MLFFLYQFEILSFKVILKWFSLGVNLSSKLLVVNLDNCHDFEIFVCRLTLEKIHFLPSPFTLFPLRAASSQDSQSHPTNREKSSDLGSKPIIHLPLALSLSSLLSCLPL